MSTPTHIYTAREVLEEIALYFQDEADTANLEISEKYNRDVNITMDTDPDDIW